MANHLVDEKHMRRIADNLRLTLGTDGQYYPSDMPAAVLSVYEKGKAEGTVSGIVDVVSLPTSDIDESAIYRVLNAAFFDGKKFRNNAFCEVVEWGADPTSAGEEAFQEIDGVSTNFSYYDAKSNVMWLYFGSGSRQVLKNMIDAREDLNTIEKGLAKAAVNSLSGWKTKDDLTKIAGNYISLPGGKVIYSLDEVTSVDEEYLLLYKEMFVYKDGEWINLDGTDEYVGGLVESIESNADKIISLQESLIGGDSV
ncbi:MAG: hypothetical protein IKK30_03955 [Clostridia bacterium]|nr:hypothetical protein [Clostridia bacterium]